MVPYPVSFKLSKSLVADLDEIAGMDFRNNRTAAVIAALDRFVRNKKRSMKERQQRANSQ